MVGRRNDFTPHALWPIAAGWQRRRFPGLRIVILTVVACGSFVRLRAAAPAPARSELRGRHPNILLILADDVGREVLGCYGGQSYHTPHLDALAASGLRFEHAYAMPVCHPTRVCLMTGRYPFQLGNPRWGTFPKQAEKEALGHVMKRAGYRTAIAGKWQLTLLRRDPQHPFRLGFDEYCLFGWHEGPRYYRPLIYQNGRIRNDVADRYGPDVYVEFLTDFIARDDPRPFFALYSMALCHDVTDDLNEPVPFGPRGRYDNYAEMVHAMDERVGRLMAFLDRKGLADDTLVLFTADNGTPSGTYITVRDGKLVREPVFSRIGGRRIRGGKGRLTDWGTRVPLIAVWPGVIRPGTVTQALVDMSDYLPTFAELGGLRVQRTGHSFVPVLTDPRTSARKWVFAEHGGRAFVRDRRWKLYSDGKLFDLAADPEERHPCTPPDSSAEAAAARTRLANVFAELAYKARSR
ncbi:MAG: Cerebroside-sulfatase [Planctomycetota bacterium]|nr:MAG: Cerebroside-sulfatase [Planctomycetota bacterium]